MDWMRNLGRISRSSVLYLGALTAASLVAAAERGDSPSPSASQETLLPTVTVTGVEDSESLTTPSIGKARENLRRVPGGTDVIDSERIREGANLTVTDTLDFTPGVYVGDAAAGPGERSRLSIRGSNIVSDIAPIRDLKRSSLMRGT